MHWPSFAISLFSGGTANTMKFKSNIICLITLLIVLLIDSSVCRFHGSTGRTFSHSSQPSSSFSSNFIDDSSTHRKEKDNSFKSKAEEVLTGNEILNLTDSSRPYYGDFFDAVYEAYTPVHGYLSVIVCIFGIFANIMTMIVMSQKEMRSPTNFILACVAFSNLIVNMDYIPYVIRTSVNPVMMTVEPHYYWALIIKTHASISVTFHSIGSWLIVDLSIWRYISVSLPSKSKVYCTNSNAKLLVICTSICIVLILIPLYLSFEVKRDFDEIDGKNVTGYVVHFSELSQENNSLLLKINFWMYFIFLKLIPCVLMSIMSIALVRVLMEAEKRRQRLKSPTPSAPASDETVKTSTLSLSLSKGFILSRLAQQDSSDCNDGRRETEIEDLDHEDDDSNNCKIRGRLTFSVSKPSDRGSMTSLNSRNKEMAKKKKDKTTLMLLVILVIYLLGELPVGILYFLLGILDDDFRDCVYQPLGELMDIVVLTETGVNFVLLVIMSRQFRQTFRQIFCPRDYIRRFSRRQRHTNSDVQL